MIFRNKQVFEKQKLFIASYCRQLSEDIKMYNYKIKTGFVRPDTGEQNWFNSYDCTFLYS